MLFVAVGQIKLAGKCESGGEEEVEYSSCCMILICLTSFIRSLL